MSVSVYVAGIREPDGKLGDMTDLLIRCRALGIGIPHEVKSYFSDTEDEHSIALRQLAKART